MIEYKILIYEPDAKTSHKVQAIARQVGMFPLEADTPAKAAALIAANFFELAFININAEKVILPKDTRRIAAGLADVQTVEKLLFYRADGIIPYPLNEPAAPAALLRKQQEVQPGTSPLDYLTINEEDIIHLPLPESLHHTETSGVRCANKINFK